MTIISRLTKLETTIAAGMETFLDVGRSMKEIRDDRLYRDGYDSFETYAKERWGWGRTYVSRVIKAVEIDDSLDVPIGTKPKTESQYREVSKAPTELQATVVETAQAKAAAEQREPTAVDYREAREEVCRQPEYEDCDEVTEVAAFDPKVVRAFERCECRLGTLKEIVKDLDATERMILRDFIDTFN